MMDLHAIRTRYRCGSLRFPVKEELEMTAVAPSNGPWTDEFLDVEAPGGCPTGPWGQSVLRAFQVWKAIEDIPRGR